MFKKFLALIVICISVCFLSSCASQKPTEIQIPKVWDESNHHIFRKKVSSIFREKTPVLALWYLGGKHSEDWQKSKRFYSVDELRILATEISHGWYYDIDKKRLKEEVLKVYFSDGYILHVPFYIDDDTQEWVGTRGRSKRLWQLLLYKKVSPSFKFSTIEGASKETRKPPEVVETALHKAVRENDIEQGMIILAEDPNTINKENSHGQTALHMATESGKYNFAKMLVEKGAKLNVRNNGSMNPLMIACKNNLIHFVKLFLENGANPIQNHYRLQTNIEFAKQHKNEEMVKLLEEYIKRKKME